MEQPPLRAWSWVDTEAELPDIEFQGFLEVMAAQSDLVDIHGRYPPRSSMAPLGSGRRTEAGRQKDTLEKHYHDLVMAHPELDRRAPFRSPRLLTEIPALDEVLQAHAAELGRDFTAYRNHTYRVVNLGVAFSSGDPEPLHKMALAAAFHDLGIWTDGTFDYLPPSVRLAQAHLVAAGKEEWTPEITAMILEHHKISAYRENPHWLVEPFRRADWVDVTHGLRKFGLPRSLLAEIFATWPDAGFHRRLLQLELRRLRTHPWNPLPMVRL